jgi:hypothetical protein
MSATQVTMVTGERYELSGAPEQVERAILSAARGSLLEFAWLEDAASGRVVGINPAHVVSLRAVVAGDT